MRTIVHLSDIHFGRVNDHVISPLIEAITKINPDLVAVSGDLTQRARSHQFKEARAFLESLPKPQIVVPGNHDVPLHNVFARFMQPLRKYRRYITNDLRPFYHDEEIAVLGVNTTRSLTIKGGRINEAQVAWMRDRLFAADAGAVKVVVTHHPFDLPEGHDERALVGRARMAMEHLASCAPTSFLPVTFTLAIRHTAPAATRSKATPHWWCKQELLLQVGAAVKKTLSTLCGWTGRTSRLSVSSGSSNAENLAL